MKLSFIGAGYVGLVTAACFADSGNEVVCVDKDFAKVEKLKMCKMPIYEPGLHDIVERMVKEGRLSFTTDLSTSLKDASICFITVDTPPDVDGCVDLTNAMAVAENIGELMEHELIVVTKSTVPVGTTLRVKEIIVGKLRKRGLDEGLVTVVSNPEYLKEGDAVNDFKKPYRVIIGVEKGNDEVVEKMHHLFSPFMRKSDRFIVMDIATCELCKYASNSMLATRISFMNSLARLCERVGADIELLRTGMGKDPRIGPEFLFAGVGYGGSCFPKDVKALIQMGKEVGLGLSVVESVDRVNEEQRDWFWNKIEKIIGEEIEKNTFAIWGGAFKANTDDIRFSPALFFIDKLLAKNVRVRLYDPVAVDNIRSIYGNKVEFFNNAYECLSGVKALIITTDWNEFRSPDFAKMSASMKDRIIFDGRNLYDVNEMRRAGFQYVSVGRKNV